jgi:hypothetical protein
MTEEQQAQYEELAVKIEETQVRVDKLDWWILAQMASTDRALWMQKTTERNNQLARLSDLREKQVMLTVHYKVTPLFSSINVLPRINK